MKNKITQRLVLYFFIVVLINSLITGGIFLALGNKAYIEGHKEDLSQRAETIAQGVSDSLALFESEGEEAKVFFQQGQKGKGQGQGQGLGQGQRQGEGGPGQGRARIPAPTLNWMSALLEGNIWIIYKEDGVLQRGTADLELAYEDLSDQEQAVIDQAFDGQTVTTESFENIFQGGTLSALAPLKDSDGTVYGAVLLHENVSAAQGLMNTAVTILLISVLIGMAIALVFIFFFAHKFIQPINRIDAVAKVMIGGDYRVKTQVAQDDEIGDLAKNMDELAIRLEEGRIERDKLDKMRNDFISNMSHELKTPVTVMKSSLEGLVSGIIPETEIDAYHHVLYEEISVLERLVMDLMELNAVRNRSFPMNFEEEDLISILRDAARSQRILAGEKDLEVVMDIQDPYYLMACDYTRIRQMFITVINNGIKYSDPGSPVIIRQFTEGDRVKIQVINKGKPIAPEERDRIFESFFRSKDTTQKGFGLGLAIAKEIADRHGIGLALLAGPDGETIFEFTI